MAVQFAINAVELVEFGVGLDEAQGQRFVLVPVDAGVQAALQEMVSATRSELTKAGEASPYDPGEKYTGHENLRLPLHSELASNILRIHNAVNLPVEPKALSDPANAFCYFARMRDGEGHRLTAIRRATTFKGVLKSRLLQLVTDALKIVPDKIFKLDRDFDVLVDVTGIQILHPAGFEFVGSLEGAILAAVQRNVKAVKADLPFVDFGPIQSYAGQHPRAARSLASIRVQQEFRNIDKGQLKKTCELFDVEIREVHGKLVVEQGSIMDFLGVLDRRLYQVELVKGSPESFRAASRSRIPGVSRAYAAATKP